MRFLLLSALKSLKHENQNFTRACKLKLEKNDNGDELWNQREAKKAVTLTQGNQMLKKYDETY